MSPAGDRGAAWWTVGAVVALVVVAGVAGVAGLGAAQASGVQLSVTSVTVSPEQPSPGQRVTLTTTVRNAQSSSESVTITDLYVRRAGGSRDLARVEDLGTVSVGSSLEVPLTTSFPEEGVQDLRVSVVARTASDTFIRLQYPVSVVVGAVGAQVAIEAGDAVAGVATPLNVTVTNGDDAPVRNLELTVGGADVDVDDPRRIAARLDGGQERTFAFRGQFAESGERSVTATLDYVLESGERRTVEESLVVPVQPLRADVAVSASLAREGTVDPGVSITVSNFGNAPARDVAVRLVNDGSTVARQLVGDVQAGSTATAVIGVQGLDDTALDVVATYRIGGEAGEATTTLRYVTNPGRVVLTGLDVEREDGLVRISGSAANVGLGQVDSVIVRVLPADGVTPAAPNREYFVGTVPASDFVSFDLTARVDGGVEAVPVEVTYLAGGAERADRVTVDLGDLPAGEPSGDRPGVGLWPAAAGGLVVAAVVAALIVVGWRNRVGD